MTSSNSGSNPSLDSSGSQSDDQISDLTGIPRPTVIRKLVLLQKNQWVQKDKNGRYTMMDSQNTKELNKWRIKNIEKISTMIGRIFNAARLIEVKEDTKKKQ